MTRPLLRSSRQPFALTAFLAVAPVRLACSSAVLLGIVVCTVMIWNQKLGNHADAQGNESVRGYIANVAVDVGDKYGLLCSEEVFTETGYPFVATELANTDSIPVAALAAAWSQSTRKFSVSQPTSLVKQIDSHRLLLFTDAKQADRTNDSFVLLADAVELRPYIGASGLE